MWTDECFPVYRSGECDRCHGVNRELFGLADDEEGEWEYCSDCIRAIRDIRRRKRARRSA